SFIARANALANEDSKFHALLHALTLVTERTRKGQGSGKLVVFTESIKTQEYVRDRLIERNVVKDEEITLFRGTNDSRRAHAALARWRREVPQDEGVRPSASIAMRLALVHEFQTRSRVFISTEAGAEALVGVLGANVEAALRQIWERSRTLDEVHAELKALRDRVDDEKRRFEETHARTRSVIEQRFDDEVQKVFRLRKHELPKA